MPHIHEEYDFVVTAFIVFENRVLFVNHPRYNKWLPIGGHVELNEDPEETLFREIKEESGLEVSIMSTKPKHLSDDTKFLLTPSFIDVHEANLPHKHIGLVYFAKSSTADYKISSEHTDMKWLSETDLDNPEYNLSASLKFYSQEAIKKASEN